MSYNLKNKAVAVIALAFVFTLTVSHAGAAAEENAAVQAGNTVSANPVDGLIQPVNSAAENISNAADSTIKAANAVAATASDIKNDAQKSVEALQNLPTAPNPAPINEAGAAMEKAADEGLDFLNEQSPDDFLNSADLAIGSETMPAPATDGTAPASAANGTAPAPADAANAADPLNDPSLNDPSLNDGFDELKDLDQALPLTDAPKSPLERFGNAILSKVDNNLFNQMSHIEKEATLLQLEKKREELRAKVLEERQKSLAIIEATRRAKMQLEEERKKAEAERQAKILEEERKLKEREMELEKLRQGKVINDYMNEMLMMNQQWVEKSAKLQARIKELEDERVELIEVFKTKITSIDEQIQQTKEHAIQAANEHLRVVANFKAQIEELEKTINDLNRALRDSQRKIKEIQEAAVNPFNEDEDADGDNTPNKNDVDMSREYAIMDITGQGDDIVAKIVNSKGKIFIVHKGSMLKNGEVVTSITDHYISFENKGIKSYLYTGDTIMEYEPEESFGGAGEFLSTKSADKDDSAVQTEPVLEEGMLIGDEKKIKEKPQKKEKAQKQTQPRKVTNTSKRTTSRRSKRKNTGAPGTVSTGTKSSSSNPQVALPTFGSGMFVE